MANGKNNVIVYRDWITIFDKLTDDEAGKLIKHFFKYINDLNPEAPDRLTDLMFEQIKVVLKRDLKKWEEKSKKNSEIAKKRWDTNACERTKRNAKNADSDNDSDSDRDSVNDNDIDSNKLNKTLLSKVDESTLNEKEKNYYKIAHSFWELFRSNLLELNLSINEIEKAEFEKWVNPIRLLMEKDEKNISEIREVFEFIRDDDFWKRQIQSTAKFRKKDNEGIKYFDKLLIKSRDGKRKQQASETRESGVSQDYKESILARLLSGTSSEEMP